jgi:hypothetical protein
VPTAAQVFIYYSWPISNMALKNAKLQLKRLWNARDENIYVGVDGAALRKAFGTRTDWGKQIGANDEQWQGLASFIQRWNVEHVLDQMDEFNAGEEKELKSRLGGYFASACGAVANDAPLADVHCGGWNAVMEEIESRLQRTLPSIGEVRRRLGDESAEQYRCGIESLEERGWTLTVARGAPSPRMLNGTCISIVRPTRRVGRAQELRDIASLVEIGIPTRAVRHGRGLRADDRAQKAIPQGEARGTEAKEQIGAAHGTIFRILVLLRQGCIQVVERSGHRRDGTCVFGVGESGSGPTCPTEVRDAVHTEEASDETRRA